MTEKVKHDSRHIPEKGGASHAGIHYYGLYKHCRRKWYLRHKKRIDSLHTHPALIAGSAFHAGKEVFYRTGDAVAAVERLVEEVEGRKTEFADEQEWYIAKERGPLMLSSWIEDYGKRDLDTFEIQGVEEELAVPVGDTGFYLTMRIDAILRAADGVSYIFDTKTSGFSYNQTLNDLRYGEQVIGYSWGLQQTYPNIRFGGFVGDITFWAKRSTNPEMIRNIRSEILMPDPHETEEWVMEMGQLINEVSVRAAAVDEGMDEHAVFPRNRYWCSAFGRPCEYTPICYKRDLPEADQLFRKGFYVVPEEATDDERRSQDDVVFLV